MKRLRPRSWKDLSKSHCKLSDRFWSSGLHLRILLTSYYCSHIDKIHFYWWLILWTGKSCLNLEWPVHWKAKSIKNINNGESPVKSVLVIYFYVTNTPRFSDLPIYFVHNFVGQEFGKSEAGNSSSGVSHVIVVRFYVDWGYGESHLLGCLRMLHGLPAESQLALCIEASVFGFFNVAVSG